MKTTIKWIDIKEQKPRVNDICLVVFKPWKCTETGDEGPAGIVNGCLRWMGEHWDHPQRPHMPSYGRVRQDITHWALVSDLELEDVENGLNPL